MPWQQGDKDPADLPARHPDPQGGRAHTPHATRPVETDTHHQGTEKQARNTPESQRGGLAKSSEIIVGSQSADLRSWFLFCHLLAV